MPNRTAGGVEPEISSPALEARLEVANARITGGLGPEDQRAEGCRMVQGRPPVGLMDRTSMLRSCLLLRVRPIRPGRRGPVDYGLEGPIALAARRST